MKNLLLVIFMIVSVNAFAKRSERFITLQLRVERCIPQTVLDGYSFDHAVNICVDQVKSTVATSEDKKLLELIRTGGRDET